jgi:secreted PhoX family phosphatase
MRLTRARITLVAATGVALGATTIAAAGMGGGITPVPNAQPKAPGMTEPNILTPKWIEYAVAQGSNTLENPSATFTRYGYANNGPLLPLVGTNAEASKTEPDKNTYLVFKKGLNGPDPSYNYGTHFLFQGHEETDQNSYFTRINLDADAAHRITLLGALDTNISADGSTWDPWAKKLLFTGETSANNGGVWQAGPDYPSTFTQLTAIGYGGFEGIQNDSAGDIYIVSDIGGPTQHDADTNNMKPPNSYIYRFVPTDRKDLTKGGKLQALQVASLAADHHPIVRGASNHDDTLSQDVLDLHKYGNVFQTKWVTIHDSGVDGMATFDANAAAKAAQATPFKRPENGVFRPGTKFRQFFFTETGDTNTSTAQGAAYGVFGGIFKLSQASPKASTGHLTIFFLGESSAHMGLDNISFLDKNTVMAVEDAGDGAHTGRNALDSGYAFDTRTPLGTAPNPVRFLAEGRDPSATIDSGMSDAATPGFTNEGDNEITGIHVSNGDPSVKGVLGARNPTPFKNGWRIFWTQQHGDNVTWEILPARGGSGHHHDG